MRILCLSTWFPYPPDNGSKIRAYHLLRALATAHHQVTLVAFRPATNALNSQDLVSDLGISDLHAVAVDPFRYVAAPQGLKFCSPIPLAYWPSRLMRQAVAKTAGTGSWHAVVSIQAPAARYASQLPAVPRVLDVDTSLTYQMHGRYLEQNGAWHRLQAWASWQKSRRHEISLFRRFQACTVVSRTELDYVRAMGKGSQCQVELSPNGVDCEYHRPGLLEIQPFSLVYNGALTYSANYDAMHYFLAVIYPLIKQQVPEATLTITGSLSGVDLSRLSLDKSVRLSGQVDDIRVPVARATVCVVPLRKGAGTRIKILEAMALGTPVVATSKGAEGLDVTADHDILIADDPGEFAVQVVRLLRSDSLHGQLAKNARLLVERQYDWRQIGERFVALVEKVAKRRGRGPSRNHAG